MVYNGRSKGKMKSRGMGTKAGRRPPASRSLKAVVTPDVSPESPFDGMSMFGSLLICDPSVGNTRNYVSFEDLDEFCNAKFDIDRFYDEVYTRSERDVATYIRMYGALAVEVRGALIIAGHEQIVREYGYDNADSRAKALDLLRNEAEIYMQWADGDVWQAIVYDDHTDDESVPDRVVIRYDPWDDDEDGDIVDSLGELYGQEYAEQEAKRMIVDERESRGQTPNFAKGSASRKAPKSRSAYSAKGRPSVGQYDRARYARATSGGHSILRVYYDPGESEMMGRPVYDVVARKAGIPGLIWGKDYDPASGLWSGGDYDITREKLERHAMGHDLIREYGQIPADAFGRSKGMSQTSRPKSKPKVPASKAAKPKSKAPAKKPVAKPKAEGGRR